MTNLSFNNLRPSGYYTILTRINTSQPLTVDNLVVEYTDLQIDQATIAGNVTVGVLASSSKTGMLHLTAGANMTVGVVQYCAVKIYNSATFTIADSSLANSAFSSTRTAGLEVYPNFRMYSQTIFYLVRQGNLIGITDLILEDTEEVILYLNGSTNLLARGQYVFNNVSLSSSSAITIVSSTLSNTTLQLNCSSLQLVTSSSIVVATGGAFIGVTNNANVDNSSSITATGSGYTTFQGPSPGKNTRGAGCHGGLGGDGTASTGGSATYGNLFAPVDFGSGGVAAAGGGSLRFRVGADFRVDGLVGSDGATGCGAGAGKVATPYFFCYLPRC